MPGFNICGSGAGEAAISGKVEVRRNYRWMLNLVDMPAWAYVKSANRPKLTLGVIDQHHNQEKIAHEGKTSWEDLTCTFYDVEDQPDTSKSIYEWLEKSTYDIKQANAQHPRVYKKDFILRMLRHDGSTSEQWKYCNAWPFSIDWGGVDYSAEEICMVAVTFKYDRAMRV